MTCLVFLVLTHLPPTVAIFITNGVFMVQAVVNVKKVTKVKKCIEMNWSTAAEAISQIVAFLLLSGPILAAAIYIGINNEETVVAIALPLCLFAISSVWSTRYQHHVMVPKYEQNPRGNIAAQNQPCML